MVLGVFTDNSDPLFAADDFAVLADFFNGSSDFHG